MLQKLNFTSLKLAIAATGMTLMGIASAPLGVATLTGVGASLAMTETAAAKPYCRPPGFWSNGFCRYPRIGDPDYNPARTAPRPRGGRADFVRGGRADRPGFSRPRGGRVVRNQRR